jgi:hypothetical protein
VYFRWYYILVTIMLTLRCCLPQNVRSLQPRYFLLLLSLVILFPIFPLLICLHVLRCQFHYCLHMWCWYVVDEVTDMFFMLHMENMYVGGQWETYHTVYYIHSPNSQLQACMHCIFYRVGNSSGSKDLCCWWAYDLHIRKQGVGPGKFLANCS